MSYRIQVPEKVYKKRKKMSQELGVPMSKTFEITDHIMAELVKEYRPRGRGKKKRFIIDIKE